MLSPCELLISIWIWSVKPSLALALSLVVKGGIPASGRAFPVNGRWPMCLPQSVEPWYRGIPTLPFPGIVSLGEVSLDFLICKMGMVIPPQDSKFWAQCRSQRWLSRHFSCYYQDQCCYDFTQSHAANIPSTRPPAGSKAVKPLHLKILGTLASSST